MTNYNRYLFLMGFIITIILVMICNYSLQAGEKSRLYRLATANLNSTFYPIGVGIATLTKVKLEPVHQIALSAITSAGSAENIKLLRKNEAQFAILPALYGSWAWNGKEPLELDRPQRYLRSVTILWRNVEHIIVKTDQVKTGTVIDLKQLNQAKFVIGERDSGSYSLANHILALLGIDTDNSFNPIYLSYEASVQALKNDNNIKGMNIADGVPIKAVTRAFTALGEGITVLDFTDEQLERLNNSYPLWSRYIIPPETYPKQKKAINSIAQPSILVVRTDIAAEDVYLMTKLIYENLPTLHSIHKATQDLNLAKATHGLPIPLHPGAVRYYQEKGLKIPVNLIME